MQAEDADALLVLARRAHEVAETRGVDPQRHEVDHDEDAEGEPVEVARVHDADEEVRHLIGVEAQPLLPSRDRGVAAHEHRTRLRERERDHRERDARDAHRDGARREGDDHAAEEGDEDARPQRNSEVLERDPQAVRARAEVQGMAEGQHPGAPEQQVVRQRERREHHAEGQQRQGARHVRRRREDAGKRDVQQRQDRHEDDEHRADDRGGEPARALG